MFKKEIMKLDINSVAKQHDGILNRELDELLIKEEFISQTSDMLTGFLRLILFKRKVTANDFRIACDRFYGNDPTRSKQSFQNMRRSLANRDHPVTSSMFQRVLRILNLTPISLSMIIGESTPQGKLDGTEYKIEFVDIEELDMTNDS